MPAKRHAPGGCSRRCARWPSQGNLELAERELNRLLSQALGADVKPIRGTTGGYPSLTYGDVPVATIPGAQSRLVALFSGAHEHPINCQSTSDHRDEVNQACDQALQTLKPK